MIWDIAYLINLPERKEKLEYALWELRNVGIEPKVISGLVMNDRELACKTTHLNIMKTVLKENMENESRGKLGINPLIIEDDLWIQGIVDISKDLQVSNERKNLQQQSIDNFWQKIRKYDDMLNVVEVELGGWDLFFFYCDMRYVKSRVNIIKKDENFFYKDDYIIIQQKINDDYLLESVTNCTHFYVINKKSLIKVIKIIETDKEHAIDRIIINNSINKNHVVGELKVYCASQNLVCQCTNFPTDIPQNSNNLWNGNLNGIFKQRW